MLRFNTAFKNIASDGWLSEGEAKAIWQTAKKTKGPIVEVGSYKGRSATLFAQLERPVFCIDPWDNNFSDTETGEEIFNRFKENTSKYSNIVPLREKVENLEPQDAEFVYLDGDHTYEGTLAQIKFALKCNPKYIAIHDVNDQGGGLEVKRAALELLGEWNERIERVAIWKL